MSCNSQISLKLVEAKQKILAESRYSENKKLKNDENAFAQIDETL